MLFRSGIFKNQLGDILGGVLGNSFASDAGVADGIGGKIGAIINAAAAASDSGYQESVAARRNKALRDKAIEPGGPLSEFIWVSVDTVDQAVVRARGLDGVFNDFTLNFHYELSSVGEVNSKAAMVDILGNLLSLTTNYGNFLTPEIRYDNSFPAVNFPGGDEGLSQFYTDPVQFIKTLIRFAVDPNQTTNGDPVAEAVSGTINSVAKARDYWSSLITQMQNKTLKDFAEDLGNSSQLNNILLYALTEKFTQELVFPSAVLTGLPTGEWHLVVGNPCNPIAMMGNLICKSIDITFGETLGPDDFPTELTAKVILKHGRARERGEIESMFNRGGGRLYQSVTQVYSNSQSTGAFGTVNGNVVTSPNKDGTSDLSTFYGPGLSTDQYQPDDI